MNNLKQIPAPGSRRVRYAGDTMTVTLELPRHAEGAAFIRTNLGHLRTRQRELSNFFETGRVPLGRDWHDIPMRRVSRTVFEALLPLNEVGVFEFKTCFIPSGGGEILWPEGENSRVKIEPTSTYSANSIYNAFIRQFGPHMEGGASMQGDEAAEVKRLEESLDARGYTVIPPSGTFRNFKRHLDFIINQMGFHIIQLLPVHPVPTTYARMGRFGSPFAPLDFFGVDRSLADFDTSCTPKDQFIELIDEIHARNAMIFIDLPADHTGWASVLQSQHPEWFKRNQDGSFESPGAWGVVWADLCKLDFSQRRLWDYLADVFLHWCHLGIDGFRCDAGYMISAEAWTCIINSVRSQYPDTVFFLEGLGGGLDATERLMASAGMNWAYSELFQNASTEEINQYLEHAAAFSAANGCLVNFAETHDNNRLATVSHRHARLRTALAALFAPAGCFGMANGVEWYATEKIDVHGAPSLNWGASKNMVDLVTRLNHLLDTHPAFSGSAALRRPVDAAGVAVGLLRTTENPLETVLAVANPDEQKSAVFEWNFQDFNPGEMAMDLLSGHRIPVLRTQCTLSVTLEPAQAICLSVAKPRKAANEIGMLQFQMLKSAALRLYLDKHGFGDLREDTLVPRLAHELFENPERFLESLYGKDRYLPVVFWHSPRDAFKMTPIPFRHYLAIFNATPFTAAIFVNGKCQAKLQSCPEASGSHFAIFTPLGGSRQDKAVEASLQLNVFENRQTRRINGTLLLLPSRQKEARVALQLDNQQIENENCCLATAANGAYSLQRAAWGFLYSKYDAMMAANLNPDMPVDRRILLRRCRCWISHQGYSQELTVNCQTHFAVLGHNAARWDFTVPTGMGQNVYLAIISRTEESSGSFVFAAFRCPPPSEDAFALPADVPVTLTVRPDIDDQVNHALTKAMTGPEDTFPKAIVPAANGFVFYLPSHPGTCLEMRSPEAEFVTAPEWRYSVHFNLEESRNLEADGDLFTPGVFRQFLKENDALFIQAVARPAEDTMKKETLEETLHDTFFRLLHEPAREMGLHEAFRQASTAFVAKRSGLKTVMAGYPWFLDWGRDTLLCIRGLLAADFSSEARDIILLLASYEERGTIPNMIVGSDTSNRDTSDAPLLLVLATRDYVAQTKDCAILNEPCGTRTLLEVLVSIANHYISGTPNGIRMCTDTGLVYSPPHFTWMDTNYPACTPREGYPVEIQCFWIAALAFLAQIAPSAEADNFKKIGDLAAKYLVNLYLSSKFVGLTDCLHVNGFKSALNAVADDFCRPNQLFAITLGAIADKDVCRRILMACQGLIVPGALRSLADQPVEVPLEITWNGRLLNNPHAPYWGRYEGDEDTCRKPAYHNGTAWPWLLPMYCEALLVVYGDDAREAACSWLSTAAGLLLNGCLGHLPEVLDGNSPHHPRGCTAQAWSATEFLRVACLAGLEAKP